MVDMSVQDTQLSLHMGVEGLAEIYSDWNAAVSAAGSHFLHFPAWYQAQLQVMDQPQELLFVAVRRQGELFGVLPLQMTRLKLGPLSMAGVSLAYANEMGLCDAFLPAGIELPLAQLRQVLGQHGLRFRLMKFDCISVSSMAAGWIQAFNLPCKSSHVTKFLDVSAGREQFYSGYSSKFNRNMRRKLKKANEHGEVAIERYRNEQALVAFDTFLQLEDSGWKGREGTSIAQQPEKLRYYRALTQGYSDAGVLSVNVLTLEGKPVAAQVGVLVSGTLNLLKIAYDEAYSEISPGYLLIDGLIAESDESHFLNKISFVTGVDWIDRWKPQCETVNVAYSFGNGCLDALLKRYLMRQAKAGEPAPEPTPSSHLKAPAQA